MSKDQESWGSRVGLILAMAGNAVGLGNFLRFPVQAVNNGGGAFIIPYLVSFLVMGIPLLWVEWTMGRYGGNKGHHSSPFIFAAVGKSKLWMYFGVFGIFTNIAIASYYCYIESWTMSYVIHSIAQTFAEMGQEDIAAFFGSYVDINTSTTGIPYEAVIFYVLCLLLNTWILSKGLKGGVEKVAKIGMPILLLFGALLAIRAFTLGDSGAPEGCTDCNSFLGLNFLWQPQFSSLADPKVWLAAATQIFFTLSLGMGSIHCYASYVKTREDIVLNSMSAGWMNEFVEIVLGASVVIPIAAGYLGLEWVKENAGFGMAFQTMPYLFGKWGVILATLAGVAWFGLLFFAGITSSLAMGMPWVSFLEDEFDYSRKKAAWSFGLITLIIGLPTVFFFAEGVFDEYDYWAGSVGLMVFAMVESILFAWVFGIGKGWEELHKGADLKVYPVYKFILKYITPTMLIFIFIASLIKPVDNDWKKAFSNGWVLDKESIIGKITNDGFEANRKYFSDTFESENNGTVESVDHVTKINVGNYTYTLKNNDSIHAQQGEFIQKHQLLASINKDGKQEKLYSKSSGDVFIKEFNRIIISGKIYRFNPQEEVLVKAGDSIKTGDPIVKGSFINKIFYVDISRLLLLSLFLFISFLVYKASKNKILY